VIDVEPMILKGLQQLAPAERVERDWADVRRRAERLDVKRVRSRKRPPWNSRPARRSWRIALAAVAAVIVAIVPAVAFSASVRSFLGLDNVVEPKYRLAQVMVSTPLPGGRIARLWLAPSTQGGQCEFVTYAAAGSKPKASRMDGGGECTIGAHRFLGTLSWSFSSTSRTTPPVITGRASPAVHPAQIELRWHGGSLKLASRSGYFIGTAPELDNPPFRQLPYDVVVLDNDGHVSARSRIPTSFLYGVHWKQVQPRLHAYRVAHGCDTKDIWHCKTR
jgi:hypothetical protein